MIVLDVVKVFVPTAIAFFVGIVMTPFLTHYLYKYKIWKKKSGKIALDGKETPVFNSLHGNEELQTPRMGGIVIWGSVLITVIIIWLLSKFFPSVTTEKLNFLHRSQTWLPLFTLISGSLVGLFNDWLDVSCQKNETATGLSLKKRLLIVFFIGLIGAYWFFFKLAVSSVAIPFDGIVNIGWYFIPFFILVMMAVYAGGVIDGIDGLAGGVFASAFSAYGMIAFYQQQIDLSAFCFVIVGGILAFLWFNIPPARFYMTETGTMGLTLTLAVVAFLTDASVDGKGVLVLPIVAFPLTITVLSNIIQVVSKKFRHGKKVFLIAPIHHHFEAIGWPAYKVTMRYWVISIIFALIGVIVALSGHMA
jgi:phospho-N-acetylmuramoyl-pentapeptide-transferase